MFQVIAVDDEQNALNRFERLISQDSRLKLLSTFTKPTEAAEFVKNNQVDIAFLDIEMPEIDGILIKKNLFRMLDSCVIFFVELLTLIHLD